MTSPGVHVHLLNPLASLTDCLSGMERVLATPLPLSYRIAISRISWMYILILPFQLIPYLGWVAIPGTLGTEYSKLVLIVAAAYIMLSLLLIAEELEDPFGDDITDIDMDIYIRQLKSELNILTSKPPAKLQDFIANDENYPFGPMSDLPYSAVIEKMSVAGMRL